jgi:hypothetical protein
MKFIFLKSGDYLEFTPKPTKFIKGWFDYLFENEMEKKFKNQENSWSTHSGEQHLHEINQHIDTVNSFLNIRLPDVNLFNKNPDLNQKWLNDTHKHWAHLTDRYKNEIFDIPDNVKQSWQEINNLVHRLELGYQQDFKNSVIFEITSLTDLKVGTEDFEFSQHNLVLSYENLGRHQFNQWQVGLDSVDAETNNYNVITTSFSYFQGLDYYPRLDAPQDYIMWCERQNLEIIGPWVSLGKFKISNTWEVKEIMHRNLKEDLAVGFEL